MITRESALDILDRHGVDPNENKTFDDDGAVEDTSFYDEVGLKDEYRLMDVLGWLGYCCPWC